MNDVGGSGRGLFEAQPWRTETNYEETYQNKVRPEENEVELLQK
jgi:hypothetical protein